MMKKVEKATAHPWILQGGAGAGLGYSKDKKTHSKDLQISSVQLLFLMY